jgi:hypothetical protein
VKVDLKCCLNFVIFADFFRFILAVTGMFVNDDNNAYSEAY